MEIHFRDAIRELSARIDETAQQKKGPSIEVIVALVGIICSLGTLGLAVNKEMRESREARLKIQELELRLMESSKYQPIAEGP